MIVVDSIFNIDFMDMYFLYIPMMFKHIETNAAFIIMQAVYLNYLAYVVLEISKQEASNFKIKKVLAIMDGAYF